MAEYPSWRNFFDVVVVAATKPAFFQERRLLMERALDGSDTVKPATFPLERGRIYEGGNLLDFERALGVGGDEILYVGDHIYGDILRSKKDSAWRTAMIIQELEREIEANEQCRADFARFEVLDETRAALEDELRFYQSRVKELTRLIESKQPLPTIIDPPSLEAERVRIKRAIERIRGLLREAEAETRLIERRSNARFHAFWGSLMKEGREQSSFGKQVEDYACVYTSRVSNFLRYSPQQYFRSPRDVMAHETE
jgi:hypothetical protein